MPAMYEVQCTRCRCVPGRVSDRVVAFGQPEDDTQAGTLFAGTHAYQTASGGIVHIPHPGGIDTLDALGIKYEQRSDNQPLLEFDYLVCRDCGTLHETRQALPTYRNNDALVIAAGLAAAICTFLFVNAQWYAIILSFLIVSAVTAFAVGKVRRRHARRKWAALNEELKVAACLRCGSDRLCELLEAGLQSPFPCPCCGEQAMNYSCVGIS